MQGRSRYKKTKVVQKKKTGLKKISGRFLNIVLLVLVISSPYLVMKSPFMKVKDIKVLGAESVNDQKIVDDVKNFASSTKYFLPAANILLINKSDLSALILKDFPSIRNVEIVKKFSRNLEITVTENSRDFLWCISESNCFNMDKSGLIFSKYSSAAEDGQKLIFKGNISGNPIQKSFASPEKMKNFADSVKIFEDQDLKIKFINMSSDNEAVFSSDIGSIILNPEDDLRMSAENTLVFIDEMKSKNPDIHFSYIDARYGNKIFYR